jgi:hypothetical protein
VKLLSIVALTALFSVVSCSHFSKPCCKDKQVCCKEKDCDKSGGSCDKKQEVESCHKPAPKKKA